MVATEVIYFCQNFNGIKKILIIILSSILCTSNLLAQEEAAKAEPKQEVPDSLKPWKKGGLGNINFNQVSLTNWAAGGNSSVSGGAFLSLFAKYKKDKTQWNNTLDLAYGLIQQKNGPVIKSDDKIEFNSKYGRQATKKWFYSGLVTFKTQFAPGFDDPESATRTIISDLFSPAYVLASIGMDYKPNDKFTAHLSPITNKTTIVMNQRLANAGAFGVTEATYDDLGNLVSEGENIRFEAGAFVKMAINTDIAKNVNFQSKVDFFANYIENFGNIDVNWENLIAMKVNKFLTTSLSTHLIYDDDIKVGVDTNNDDVVDAQLVRTQFKQVFAVGLSYKF